ncbi:MAG: 3-carboxyethylcatechol 2,3-dioxygenase [Microthrixaceae bacterium]
MTIRPMTVCASHAPGFDRDVGARQGLGFRRALGEARAAVAEFSPDLVVLFAGDHRRAFASVTPPFAVVLSATVEVDGLRRALRVPADLAGELVGDLLDGNLDVAVGRDLELDHGFRQPLQALLAEVDSVPVLPVAVNCTSPPLPRAERVVTFGQRVGRFLAALEHRVLFVGTGGLSHSPPTLVGDRHDLTEEERTRLREAGMEVASQLIDPDWDSSFLSLAGEGDLAGLTRMTDTAGSRAGVGAAEVRTWLAAIAASGQRLGTLGYEPVPEWITGMAVAASLED